MTLSKLTLTVLIAAAPMLAATCDDLAKSTLPNATINSASLVAAGAFVTPPAPVDPFAPVATKGAPKGAKGAPKGDGKAKAAPPNPFAALPAFCRVAATLTPTSDSDIKVEIWLPATGWNGKYQAVGNGGWAGTISYPAMATALQKGYATSSTDTGHVSGRAYFALEHPEKIVDYAYRSEHEMVLKSKALIQQFYGSPARLSYWVGCSTGGKQGLTEAQRYPGDFDGIIAGAPANYMIHLHVWSIWVNQANNKTPESFLDNEQLTVLKTAVLAACDAKDGVKDGLLQDPTKCKFDPATVQCKPGMTTGCLTAPQVAAAKQIYSPATNPRTKVVIFPPLEPGSEMGWGGLGGRVANSIPADTFKYALFKNPDWDPMTLNFDKDVARADDIDNGLNNAINPDLSPFFQHNGKLIMYHGWSDQLIAPENSINYYNSVAKKLGGVSQIDQNMRLFMVPGMTHCQGGDGPNTFDALSALEQWVETNQAPAAIPATHSTAGTVDRSRPLCKYPQVAKYDGSGSIDEISNFSCVFP